MKLTGITCIACVLLAVAANAQQVSTNEAQKPLPVIGIGVLSEAQIAELKQTFTDPKTKKSYFFTAELALQSMDKKTLEKYQKSGKVPFLITASLYEEREVNGKKVFERLNNGACNIYMQDKEGKVLFSKAQYLNKMCLSWGGSGGHLGEVSKEGEYTVVVYVKHAVAMFGTKITSQLSVPKPPEDGKAKK